MYVCIYVYLNNMYYIYLYIYIYIYVIHFIYSGENGVVAITSYASEYI